MKVVGFSFVRNAIKYEYPILESIQSVLPICDEFILVLGKSADGTEELVRNIPSKKIKIIPSVWDDTKREGGKVLAEECNKALAAIPSDANWAVYIQADEVLPDTYYNEVKSAMLKWKNDDRVEGLLFKYLHFYGNYDHVAVSPNWYRKEVRIIKNNPAVYSYRDAQGFRINDNQKLKVKTVNAYIHHYGWVKHPSSMQAKQEDFNKLWHDDTWIDKNIKKTSFFDYSNVGAIQVYNKPHPEVMRERIQNLNWEIDFKNHKANMSLTQKLRYLLEKLTGYRIGEYKNFTQI